jgi:hypothetical protein
MKNINLITDEIDQTIKNNYSRKNKKTIRQRYKGMSHGFDKLIRHIKDNFEKEAKEYYKIRSKQDFRLAKIQSNAVKELRNNIKNDDCLNNIKFSIIPISSFSAKTNLIGESDLDIGILVSNINEDKAVCISNIFGRIKYILSDIRNKNSPSKKHWVFQKYINNVEIECKLRDKEGFYEILKMHDYTDKKMSKSDKIYATYGKYLLKKYSKKHYEQFKMIYYCNAGYHGGTKELMYLLV